MAPRLKGGQVVNRRNAPLQASNVCTCDECKQYTTFGSDGQPVAGRHFYNKADFSEHKRLLRDVATLETHAGLPPPELAIPEPPNGARPFTLPVLPSTPAVTSTPATTDGSHQTTVVSDQLYDWRKLQDIQAQIAKHQDAEFLVSGVRSIQFLDPPSASLELPPDLDIPTLKQPCPDNSPILGYLQWLNHSLSYTSTHCVQVSSCRTHPGFRLLRKTVQSQLQQQLNATNERIRREWSRQRDVSARGQERIIGSDVTFVDCTESEQVFIVYVLMACVLHLICDVSLDFMGFVLGCLRLAGTLSGVKGDMVDSHLPRDMRTLLNRIDLNPEYTEYASCPKCFKLFPLDSFPEFCDGTASGAPQGNPCNRRLHPKEAPLPHGRKAPVQTYQHNDMRQWIASLYNRPHIAPHLGRRLSPDEEEDVIRDVWDASVLETLYAPGEQDPFFAPNNHPNEGRLLLGLNVDGFNPYGNRIAGKKASISGLYIVCLNLPPSLRFKTENMFLVGVIPGPKEPSFHEINYILAPLVDDLLILWGKGIFLSTTCIHPDGLSVMAALVPVVCDLPGARLITGFAHHSSEEFSCATCYIKDRNNIDPSSWDLRNAADHRDVATQWRDAETDEERNSIYKQHGIRWSELLRLPYWDPVRFTVIDSMHCFYLRILRVHCRDIWRMDVTLTDGDGVWEFEEPSEEEKEESFRVFRYGTVSAMKKLPVRALRYLALRMGLDCHKKKKTLLADLLEERVENGWYDGNQQQIFFPSSEYPDGYDDFIPDPAERKASLAAAKAQYQQMFHKKDLNFYDASVIRALAEGEGIENSTSETKKFLIDKLFKKVDNLTHLFSNAIKVPFEQRKAKEEEEARAEMQKENTNREQRAIMKLLKTGSKTAIDKASVAVLRDLVSAIISLRTPDDQTCDLGDDIDFDSMMDDRKEMKEFIHAQRTFLGITNESNKVVHKSGTKTAVLGKGRLAEVRDDMAKLRLPSWMPKAPSRPGEASHGKFTADQWRSFSTVNLPITLIRLWGGEPEESREHQMLTNFMHLISAVRLANMRTQTEARIVEFETHMAAYVRGLRDLFPERTITPYQHMSLHFGSMLRDFGPVHSWRCFAFERYNYILQNIPNNCRLGVLEKTIFIRFCMIQRLWSLFHETKFPDALRPISALFEKTFSSDVRGTRLQDTLASDEGRGEDPVNWGVEKSVTLDAGLNPKVVSSLDSGWTLRSNRVLEYKKIKRLGVTFSVDTVTFADSQVVFQSMADCGWSAGSIVKLFVCQIGDGTRTIDKAFAIIKRYKVLSATDATHDPYRRFGFAGGRLFYDTYSDKVAIPVANITAHFANTAVSVPGIVKKTIHVLPQNKSNENFFYTGDFEAEA